MSKGTWLVHDGEEIHTITADSYVEHEGRLTFYRNYCGEYSTKILAIFSSFRWFMEKLDDEPTCDNEAAVKRLLSEIDDGGDVIERMRQAVFEQFPDELPGDDNIRSRLCMLIRWYDDLCMFARRIDDEPASDKQTADEAKIEALKKRVKWWCESAELWTRLAMSRQNSNVMSEKWKHAYYARCCDTDSECGTCRHCPLDCTLGVGCEEPGKLAEAKERKAEQEAAAADEAPAPCDCGCGTPIDIEVTFPDAAMECDEQRRRDQALLARWMCENASIILGGRIITMTGEMSRGVSDAYCREEDRIKSA